MPRQYNNLHTFIYKLFKRVSPEGRVSSECKDILNDLIHNLAVKYVTSSIAMCRYAKKVTIDSTAITILTRIWLHKPSELLDFAGNTWDVYSANTVKGVSKATRSGLCVPPARMRELFRAYHCVDQKIGEPSYIFLAAILEYVLVQILSQAANLAAADKKLTVMGLHVYLSIKENETIRPFFKNEFIAGYGYI